jgi:murein DD-endopeptidase MepM/ murein hydrolase activator NlpD
VHVPKDRRQAIATALEAVPEANRSNWRLHRVSPGDTLASISRLYSTAPGQIMAANARLDEKFFDAPEDGEVLLIPARAKPEPTRKATSAKGKSTGKGKTTVARKRSSSPQRVAARKPAPVKTARR